MARIKNSDTDEIVMLFAQHVFGRNVYACNTFINSKDVSRSHASIVWTEGNWFLHDHSRNGTLVNGEFIRKRNVKLEPGSKIRFGNIENSVWEVLDVDAPSSYLQSVAERDNLIILNSCQALPNEQKPEVIFYKSPEASWVVETNEKKIDLKSQKSFTYNNQEWIFIENEVLQETIDYGNAFEQSYFKFCLSADEEDIRLVLVVEEQEFNLGNKSYNYVLLALARQRLADIKAGVEADKQGWVAVSELEKDVSKERCQEVDAYYLNLQIFRLRKQLMDIKPFGYIFANVIERKKGELRFAFPKLKIFKNSTCIAEVMC